MGVDNTYYVVDEELIKRRLTEQFDLVRHIEDHFVLFHMYQDLPFWRLKVRFDLNRGFYASQAILNEIDTSPTRILRKITHEKNSFPDEANLFYNDAIEVKQIWQELKKISIYRVEELLSNKDVTNRITNAKSYKMNWIENKEAMIDNMMEILAVYHQAQNRGQGIVNFIE
jgi:hypothetical protein